MFSYKYIFCAGDIYIFSDGILFLLCVIERTILSRAKRGNSMWIKRTMASEASQSVYISDHIGERKRAKVFSCSIISERRTSEASQLTSVYILYKFSLISFFLKESSIYYYIVL
nr:MAG TPA: hypothetical protein [Caudoviricetes sp.]